MFLLLSFFFSVKYSPQHIFELGVPPQVGNEQQMPDWISVLALMKDDRFFCGTRHDLHSKHERNITSALCAAVVPH